jgi:SAM-dependent methyltransferase
MEIVRHYEACLERYGDSYLGVDWPKARDVPTRYRVMLDMIELEPAPEAPRTLLDFGCGTSDLYAYIRESGLSNIEYSGLDISEKFIALCRNKFPENSYYCVDVLDGNVRLPRFDYVVMNGVFTEKRGLTFEEMFSYLKAVLRRTFPLVRIGLAFNVMSQHVDWQRDELFHLPFDLIADFLTQELSRNIVFRSDYGLYEYTTYVFTQSTLHRRHL